MIPGIPVTIGGKLYEIPNINFRTLQKITPYLKDFHFGADAGDEQMEAVLKIITAALQRNYPDIDEDFVADNLEKEEIADVIAAIGQQFTKKKTTTATPITESSSTGDVSTLN